MKSLRNFRLYRFSGCQRADSVDEHWTTCTNTHHALLLFTRAKTHTHTHTYKEICPGHVDAAAWGILSRACKRFSYHCYESQSIPCNGFTQTHICLMRHPYSPQIRCKTTNSFVPYLRLKQSYSKSEYLIALVEMAKQRYVSDYNESTSLGILQRLWGWKNYNDALIRLSHKKVS